MFRNAKNSGFPVALFWQLHIGFRKQRMPLPSLPQGSHYVRNYAQRILFHLQMIHLYARPAEQSQAINDAVFPIVNHTADTCLNYQLGTFHAR